MMIGMRKQYEAVFKAKAALDSIKVKKTIAQIGSESGVNPNQIRQWPQDLLKVLAEVFSNRRPQQDGARGRI